jgi:hypothetical protein
MVHPYQFDAQLPFRMECLGQLPPQVATLKLIRRLIVVVSRRRHLCQVTR